MKRIVAYAALLLSVVCLFTSCELKPAAPFQLGPYREGGSGRILLEGSGKTTTKTVNLPEDMDSFSLVISGIPLQNQKKDVSIIVDESLPRGIVLEADDNVLERISISVNEKTGRITAKTERGMMIVSPTALQLRVGAPVNRIVVDGAWKLAYNCPSVKDCAIELNGAMDADMQFGTLETLRVDINGASKCALIGTAQHADFELNGAAEVNAFDLIAQKASVVINGAGNCKITAEDTLQAEINGVGSVIYDGDPTLEKAIHGIGTVKKR